MDEIHNYQEGKIKPIELEHLYECFQDSLRDLLWMPEVKIGWEFLKLLDFNDLNLIKKSNNNYRKIEYLEKYIKDLSNNVITIKDSLDIIHEDYKRQIFKIYSAYVSLNLEYSEENLKIILDLDYEIEKVVKYFFKVISKRKDFDYYKFLYEADGYVKNKKIKLSLFKILHSKKFNSKNSLLDESKLIRIKLNTLVYCIFPTEDINVIDDDNNYNNFYTITKDIPRWAIKTRSLN